MSSSSYGRGGGRGGGGRGGGGRGRGRGGGGGRGEYYRNKYGGGGGGRGGGGGGRGGGRGRGGGGDGDGEGRRVRSKNNNVGGSYSSFLSLLNDLDGKNYPAYHDVETSVGWRHEDFTLFVSRAQSDPYAAPTRCRLVVPAAAFALPPDLYANSRVRAVALADWLHRRLRARCVALGADRAAGGGGWSGPKGGDVGVAPPTQDVVERSAVVVSERTGDATVQITVCLPARGRTIAGRRAADVFGRTLPDLLRSALSLDPAATERVRAHVRSVEDQEHLREVVLRRRGLVAFVRDGAVLPRASGNDDGPLIATDDDDDDGPVPFASPESLRVTLELPHSTVTGMGLPAGVTLVVGGGFHGKSTLLEALQRGARSKVPGDGREFVAVEPTAVKIRAEDGRHVERSNISAFIDGLPATRSGKRKDTRDFTTNNASGSTSQAANIVEAMEMGSTCLLVDEDTCATNFMIRDDKMRRLVANEKEPITPFVLKIRPLLLEHSVSSILVVGGSGDYFSVADRVLMMDNYRCVDVTDRAHAISPPVSSSSSKTETFGDVTHRRPVPSAFRPNDKVRVRTKHLVDYGDRGELDLSGLEQLSDLATTNAISCALQRIPAMLRADGDGDGDETVTLRETMRRLDDFMDREGLDEALAPGQYHGALARPRIFEVAAAMNRLRRSSRSDDDGGGGAGTFAQ